MSKNNERAKIIGGSDRELRITKFTNAPLVRLLTSRDGVVLDIFELRELYDVVGDLITEIEDQ
jgi:hypothetical protein